MNLDEWKKKYSSAESKPDTDTANIEESSAPSVSKETSPLQAWKDKYANYVPKPKQENVTQNIEQDPVTELATAVTNDWASGKRGIQAFGAGKIETPDKKKYEQKTDLATSVTNDWTSGKRGIQAFGAGDVKSPALDEREDIPDSMLLPRIGGLLENKNWTDADRETAGHILDKMKGSSWDNFMLGITKNSDKYDNAGILAKAATSGNMDDWKVVNDLYNQLSNRYHSGSLAAVTSVLEGTGALSLAEAAASGIDKLTGDEETPLTKQMAALKQTAQQSADEHPAISGVGNVAGNLSSLYGIGKGVKAGTGAVKVFKRLPKILQGMTRSAVTFGGLSALQNAGDLASGDMSGESFARDVGVSALGGAGGALASGLVSSGMARLLTKHGLQTPFAEFARQTLSGTAFAAGNIGATYPLEENKPTGQEIATQIGTAFLFSAIQGGISTYKTTTALKARLDQAVTQMKHEYETMASGAKTPQEIQAATDRMLQYSKNIRMAISQNYYAGQQQYINETLKALDAMDDYVSNIQATAAATVAPGNLLGAQPAAPAPAPAPAPSSPTEISTALQAEGVSPAEADAQAVIIGAVLNGQKISDDQAATIATSDAAVGILTDLTGQEIGADAHISEVDSAINEPATEDIITPPAIMEPESEPAPKPQRYDAALLQDAASTLGKNGEKALIAAYKNYDDIAPDVFFGAFAKAYNAGVNGVKYDEFINTIDGNVKLGEDVYLHAWNSGLNDAKETFNAEAEASAKAPTKAVTGNPYSAKLYHGSGKTASEIYNVVEYPVAGKGTYYALTEKAAKNYGDKVDMADVHLNNPIVVNDDVDWRKLTSAAGWEYPNMFGSDKNVMINAADNLRAYILKTGHDGLIIQFEDDWEGDINVKTNNVVKVLSNVFGHDQVVVYKAEPAKTVSTQTPLQTEPAKNTMEAGSSAAKNITTNWLSEQLKIHNYVDNDGFRFSAKYGADGKYHGSILRLRDGNGIVTNSRDRLYLSGSFDTLKEAISDLIEVAVNNGFVKEGKNGTSGVDKGRGNIRGGSAGTGGLSKTGAVQNEGRNSSGSSEGWDEHLPQSGGKSGSATSGGNGRADSNGNGDGSLTGGNESSAEAADGKGDTGLSENVSVKKPSKQNKNNYRITEDIDSKRPNYKDNYAAIKLIKQLESEGRTATEEERAILALYKGWGGLKNEVLKWNVGALRSVMTEDEYQAAKDSILNAHYTSTKVIAGIYKAIQRMGFTGGNILEPSMGVGNFFGMLPEKLSNNSSLYGVELDKITGQIAKNLYPDAKIDIAGFQDVLYPDGTFDLVVGNVPFSNDIRIPYRGTTFNLHDFFFMKTLDETKPGGVVALITSTGTLDKISGKTQSAIAKRANLIAAFRLPDNAFKTNAGTEVTTDLIFLQKKGGGIEDNGIAFTNIEKINGIPVNEYYVQHPENILGELAYEKEMYASERTVVHATDNFEQLFNKAMISLPKGLMSGETTQNNPVRVNSKKRGARGKTTFRMTSNGAEIVDADGNVQKVTGDTKKVKNEDIVKGFLEIKRAYFSLIEAEHSGNLEAATQFRESLNNVYDRFTKKHGTITSQKKLLSQDDDFVRVSGLELVKKKGKVKKSAIFTMPTVSRGKKKTAGSSQEALTISLNENGKIDLDHMAKLTGTSKDQIVSELSEEIILTPDGEYVLTAQYLSGNIYQKLDAVKGKKGFEKHEALLKATIPTPKTADTINAELGSHWIPPHYVGDFLRETFNLYGNPNVEYVKELGKWDMPRFFTQIKKYSTNRVDATNIVISTLNNKNITVYDKTEDGGRILNKKETEVAQQKQNDLRQTFREWIFKDAARRKDLEGIFNRTLNAYAPMDYSALGERVDFGVSPDSKIKLRDYQKAAAARIVFGGNTLLHHGVGTGKTATMIAAARVMKQSGVANKPVFVVPNGKVNDFRTEILGMYPDANVLAIDNESMTPSELQRTKSTIATGDWDYVIIYRTSFQKIAVSPETEAAFIQSQIDDLEQAIRENSGQKNGTTRFEKNLISRKKTLEEKLIAILSKPKDNTINFEDTGIDALFVDEAHNFKKVGFATTHSISGIDSNTNQLTTDLYMKENYMRDRGGRIVLATATPLTNTLSEMYNMTMHVNPDVLRQSDIYSFDGWLNTFADIQSQPEIAPDAKTWRIKERVRGFKSGNELIGLYRQFADVKQTKDVVNDLPKAEYIDVICEATEYHKRLLDDFATRSGNVKPGGENMLLISSDGRAAGTDLRLLKGVLQGMYPGISNEELDLPASKINKCVTNIVAEYNKSKDANGTQFVFLDLGVNDGGKRYAFNLYNDLINKLVENGIPRSEIANIQDYNGEDRRSVLYDAMNAGTIRVLLGSTAKMGEGVNAQNKAVALHHLSVPYRPDNLEQREGRIIRHGNENKNVRIYRYIQEKSFDSYLWQMIERKAAYVAQALNGGDATELEENGEAIVNAREAKAIATGNPLIVEKFSLQDKVQKLRILQGAFFAEKREAAQRAVFLRAKIQEQKAELKAVIKDAATVTKLKTDEFSMKVGNTVYTSRKEAAEALSNVITDKKAKILGEIYGLSIERVSGENDVLQLVGAGSYKFEIGESKDGNITRIVNTASNYVVNGETRIKRSIASFESGLEDAEATATLEFKRQDELDAAVARQLEVDLELGIVKNEVKFDDIIMPESGEEYTDDGGYDDIDSLIVSNASSQSVGSARTAVNGPQGKVPALFNKVKFEAGTVNLDLGGGAPDKSGNYPASEYLDTLGVTNYVYDKYNRTTEENAAVAEKTQEGQSDTVTISNVLNVIPEQSGRDEVLLNALDAVKPEGTVYITVYEGDKSGTGKHSQFNKETREPESWQENRLLSSYFPEVRKYFSDVTIKNKVMIAKAPKKAKLSSTDYLKSESSEDKWATTRVGDKDKTPMPLSDIINKIRHDFGIPITKGHIRGKDKLGQYNRKTRGIRSRIANHLPTVLHELGHHLDNVYGLTKGISKDLKDELINGMPEGTTDAYKKDKWKTEGMAEFMRHYLQNSETAAIDYPKFTPYFRSKLLEADLALVDELADEVNAYYSLDTDTASSSIRLAEERGRDFRTVREKFEDTADMVYQAFIDSNHGIKLFDQVAGTDTYKLASNSAYSDAIADAILKGDLRDMNAQYVGDGLQTVLDGINTKNKQEYRDFGEYLIVKHGPERLKEGMRIFADDRKNSSAWMETRQKELETRYPQFKEVSEKLYKFQRAFLKVWGVDTGLVSPESYKEWGERWNFYVPLNRAVGDKGRIGAKRGFANQNSTIKKAIGSGLDIVHPIDNIIYNMVKMVNAGTRNNVMAQITQAAQNNEGLAIFLEKVPMPLNLTVVDLQGVKADIDKAVNEGMLTGQINATAGNYMDVVMDKMDDVLIQYGRGHAKGDVVTVLRNGKLEYWKINDPLLLGSVTNMSPPRLPAILEAYGRVSRFMISNITGTNVVWSIFSNAPRDLMAFFTFSKDKNPLHILGGIGSAYLNKAKGNQADPIFKEYLAMGGGRTSAYTADKNLAKSIRKKVTGDKMKWLNPMEWVEYVSDTIELGPRFAYYKILRNKGLTPQEAFYESTDVTVNFRRGGSISRQLNKVIPFFNAGVQGLDKFARWISAADATNDTRAKTAQSRVVAFVAASAVLAALSWLINSGDDEAKKDYAQLSNYTKNTYWCIPLGDGKYLTIPKPREIAVLASFMETLTEYYANENKNAFDEFYNYFADQCMPNVINDLAKGDFGGAIGSLGIIGVGAYMMANRDFLGKPIVSSGLSYLEKKDQYTDRTSKMAYWIGQAFNQSPQMVDFFFQQVLGGWWKYQKALFPVGSENRDLTLGVQGQYVKDNQYSTDVVNTLYDTFEEISKKHKSNANDMDISIAYKNADSMVKFYSRYYAIAKALPEDEKNRGVRQTVLEMIIEFNKSTDSGTTTGTQEAVAKICESQGKTEIMPSVMNTYIKDDNGGTYKLSAEEYVEYQTTYLGLYWDYVEDALAKNKNKSYTYQAAVVRAAKAQAKTVATGSILPKKHAYSDYSELTEMRTVGIDPAEYALFKAALDIANDDGSLKQEEVISAIKGMTGLKDIERYYLFHSRYDSDANNPWS